MSSHCNLFSQAFIPSKCTLFFKIFYSRSFFVPVVVGNFSIANFRPKQDQDRFPVFRQPGSGPLQAVPVLDYARQFKV